MADSKKGISIVDVAKQSGVSVATVSRVLNGSSQVRPETRELILEVALRLGYTLSERRPGPKPGRRVRRKTIALINVLDSYHYGVQVPSTYLALLRGVQEGAAQQGVAVRELMLSTEAQLSGELVDAGCAGFLLVGHPPHETAQAFFKKKACCWLMNNPWTPTWGDHVMPDHREAGMVAAEYLIGRGCVTPAIIKLGQLDRVAALRQEGFQYAAAKAGVKAKAMTAKGSLVDGEGSYPEEVYVDEVIAGMRRMKPQPDGYFIDCDRSLATLYPVMVREGLVVPGRTGLIGCNNQQPFLKGIRPHPATIDVHFEQIGRIGVSQLMWRMSNPDCQRLRTLISPTRISLN